jgi:hypothetical protein
MYVLPGFNTENIEKYHREHRELYARYGLGAELISL